MCARRRDITIARINTLLTHTYAKLQDETTFFLIIKEKKNNNEKEEEKEEKKTLKKCHRFRRQQYGFFILRSIGSKLFFLIFFVHCLLDNFLHILFQKIFIYIFLFLHKLLRNTIITHGKYSLSTTIFFLFTNCLKYRV